MIYKSLDVYDLFFLLLFAHVWSVNSVFYIICLYRGECVCVCGLGIESIFNLIHFNQLQFVGVHVLLGVPQGSVIKTSSET